MKEKKQEQIFQLFPFDNKFAARWSINMYDYESSGECVRMQNHLNGPTSPCVLAAAPVAMMRPISRFIFPEHDRRPATPPVIKCSKDRMLSTLRNWSARRAPVVVHYCTGYLVAIYQRTQRTHESCMKRTDNVCLYTTSRLLEETKARVVVQEYSWRRNTSETFRLHL